MQTICSVILYINRLNKRLFIGESERLLDKFDYYQQKHLTNLYLQTF